MTVCQFWARTLPEHIPLERSFERIDEHFVKIGSFIRYDPLDTEPRFIDPPHKRPEKNRRQLRFELRQERIVNGVFVKRGRSKPTAAQRAEQTRKDRKKTRRSRRRQQARQRRWGAA